MADVETDRALAAQGEEQHGLLTDEQALAIGLNRDQISYRVRRGTLERPYPRVLRLPGAPKTFESEALAAAWSLRDGTVGGAAGAALLRIGDARRAPVEVLVLRDRRQARPFIVRETLFLPPADRTTVGIIPVTTRERTLVDLSRSWDAARLGRALDDELAARRVTMRRLGSTAVPLLGRGHPGTPRFVALLEERSDGYVPPGSTLEATVRPLLDSGRYGRVVYQSPLPGDDAGLVDAHLLDLEVIVEVDGRRWHTRVADFQKDRRRDRLAGMAGQFPLRVAYEDVRASLAELIEALDAHVARRAAAGMWPAA